MSDDRYYDGYEDGFVYGEKRGAAAERERVVAWLRTKAIKARAIDKLLLLELALEIERGEHLNGRQESSGSDDLSVIRKSEAVCAEDGAHQPFNAKGCDAE